LRKEERLFSIVLLIALVLFIFGSFVSFSDSNLITAAVIGVQDFSIQGAGTADDLSSFYDNFSTSPDPNNYSNTTSNMDLTWNGQDLNITAKVTAAEGEMYYFSNYNLSMESFNLSTDITLLNTSATLDSGATAGMSVGLYNQSGGTHTYCELQIDQVGDWNLYLFNGTGASAVGNSSTKIAASFGATANGTLGLEYNNVTTVGNCSFGTPGTGYFSIEAPLSQIGDDHGVMIFSRITVGGPPTPTGDLNATAEEFNYTVAEQVLVDCGTITTDTTMDQNVTIDDTCFVIGANDITLDCAGYEINYSNAGTVGYGVNITNYEGVTVKNCLITEGISTGNGKSAVFVTGSSAITTTIYNNTISLLGQQSAGLSIGSSAVGLNFSGNDVMCVGGCTGTTISSNNLAIQNNTFNSSGFSSRGIDASTMADSNISQNTIILGGNIGNGISFSGSRNIIENNVIEGTKTNVVGISFFDSSENNTISENLVNLSGSGGEALQMYVDASGTPLDNIFLNNNVTATDYGFHDKENSSSNTILYNNSFGTINWTGGNLTTQVNLTMDVNIFLEDNNLGFQHEDQDGSGEHLNGTSELTFYGLTSYTITPQLLKDGVRCDDGNACNISFDATNDILYANISSFSNYTTLATDTTSPNVTNLLPAVNTVFNVSNVVEIAANVTSGNPIGDVTANISYPNGTNEFVTLSNGTNHEHKFNVSFTAPTNIGTYNITFFGNDTLNNLNSSETSNFTVNDVVNPSVGTLVPAVNSVYNVTNVIEINATVTDDVNLSRAYVNITYPNGTNDNIELTLDGSNVFNTTFTAPALIGLYNLTFYANDSSGNENRSEVSNFTINDIVNPSVGTLVPAVNSLFNVSAVVEINATITDDVNVSQVFANVTLPNGTIEEYELTLDGSNVYNTTYTVPSVHGTFNITFIANDTTGNYNTTEVSNFTVDATAPIITIEGPAGTVNGTNVVLNITTDEAATCQYANSTDALANFGTTGSTSHNQTIATMTAGSKSYTFSCNDSSNNNVQKSMVILVSTVTKNKNATVSINATANVTSTYETISNVNVSLNLSSTFSTNFTISVEEYNDTPEDNSFSVTGSTVTKLNYYTIDAPSIIGNINLLTFAFDYADADVTAAGITEANLAVYFYNTSSSAWEEETATTVDTTANHIETNVTHLSTFVLGTATVTPAAAAAAAAASSSSSSGGGGSLPPQKVEQVVEATQPTIEGESQQLKPIPSPGELESVVKDEKGGCPLGVGCAILNNFTGGGISFTLVWIILVVLVLVIGLGATLHHLHKKKLKK